MSRGGSLVVAAVLALAPGSGLAQPGHATTPIPTVTGDATLDVRRSLNVASMRPMRLSPRHPRVGLSISGGTLADAPAVIQVSGDPGRLYRIRVPRVLLAGGNLAVVEELRVWSANSGDVTQARVARMDPMGRDLLRVSGRLRVLEPDPAGDMVATLPLSIDYE